MVDTLPTIVGISLTPMSSLVVQGYPSDVAAVEHTKGMNIFSDARHILQMFFGESPINTMVKFDHDSECDRYPDVYEAWKAAGQEDNCPCVATCASLGQW